MKNIECTECGCKEFITQLNQYDVYEVFNGELQYVSTERINDEVIFYCRDCGEILKNR